MGQKLVFRYYSLAHFSKRLQAVEIKKATFYKFEFRKKLLGLQSYVILYQKVAQNIAKYPPISVSLLSKRQRNELVTSLTMFQKVQ